LEATFLNPQVRSLAKAYLIVKRYLLTSGYDSEIDWQYSVSLHDLNEQIFLRESAWVILCGGFHENIIRKKFPRISKAFFNWKSAIAISQNAAECKEEALRFFNHKLKIDAIISIASYITNVGFPAILSKLFNEGIHFLQQLFFIGPVTSLHLAKNIGIPVAKPDRHLINLAKELGYGDVQQLCSNIANITSEPIAVVDLVLWRYLTLNYRNSARFSRLVGCLCSD
jgi:hypothetical protein